MTGGQIRGVYCTFTWWWPFPTDLNTGLNFGEAGKYHDADGLKKLPYN